MVYQELVNYIRGAKAAGYGEEQLRRVLAAAGWREEDVSEAMQLAEKLKPRSFDETKKQIISAPLVETDALTRGEYAAPASMQDDESLKKFSVARAWLSCISQPANTFKRARYHASYAKAVLGFAAPPMLLALAGAAAALLSRTPFESLGVPSEFASALSTIGVLAAAFAGIAAAVVATLSGFASSAVSHAVARALGGTASFKQHVFLSSIASVGTIVLVAVSFAVLAAHAYLAGSVPAINVLGADAGLLLVIAAALSLAIALRVIDANIIAVREAQLLPPIKALAASLFLPSFWAWVLAAAPALLLAFSIASANDAITPEMQLAIEGIPQAKQLLALASPAPTVAEEASEGSKTTGGQAREESEAHESGPAGEDAPPAPPA